LEIITGQVQRLSIFEENFPAGGIADELRISRISREFSRETAKTNLTVL
jgi:hypothetical protein